MMVKKGCLASLECCSSRGSEGLNVFWMVVEISASGQCQCARFEWRPLRSGLAVIELKSSYFSTFGVKVEVLVCVTVPKVGFTFQSCEVETRGHTWFSVCAWDGHPADQFLHLPSPCTWRGSSWGFRELLGSFISDFKFERLFLSFLPSMFLGFISGHVGWTINDLPEKSFPEDFPIEAWIKIGKN